MLAIQKTENCALLTDNWNAEIVANYLRSSKNNKIHHSNQVFIAFWLHDTDCLFKVRTERVNSKKLIIRSM